MENKKRLIDANALKAHINSVSTHWLNDWSTLGVLATVDRQPTVDAVEVVRCKDCNFWRRDGETNKGECDGMEVYGLMDADFFCSYGERRRK
jgi:hypothetical protein